MPTEPFDFPGRDGTTLSGVLHRPGDRARGSVLLAHCFTCGKDVHTMTRLARGLEEAGYACLRFDFTGLGDSGGRFEDSTFARNVDDLVRAATALIGAGLGPCGMVGHSLGGAAALLAAQRIHTVRAVAVVGAPSSPSHVRHLFADEEDAIAAEGCRTVSIAGRPFPITEEFLDALDHDLRPGELDRPVLVVHSPTDEVVPVDEGEAVFAALASPRGFWPLVGADHLVTDRRRADELARVLVTWLDATLADAA